MFHGSQKTGLVNLPMHWGKAPYWLLSRMTKLARNIITIIIEEYGSKTMLSRLSDPFWFQAFGCVLGFDWHSSGITTTVCGAIKQGLKGLEKNLNFYTAGGKGGASRKTPKEIIYWAEKTNLKVNAEKLIYSSRMCAKVDNTAIQDGYQLYHHNFFFSNDGTWTIVQQGMNLKNRLARRYHWMSENFSSFVNEPHSAICCDYKNPNTLNLVSKKSNNVRKVITDISKQNPDRVIKEYKKISTLNFPKREWIEPVDIKSENLRKILISTYETQPNDFENLLNIKGLGSKSIRALTLISELAYGTKSDWSDPVKYSFSHGGKDGYPYPVDKENYDNSIDFLKKAIMKSKTSRSEKKNALLKLFEYQSQTDPPKLSH